MQNTKPSGVGSLLGNIRAPYRCLALAVIYQAFLDGIKGSRSARRWLRSGKTLDFWCDAADITKRELEKGIRHWFTK